MATKTATRQSQLRQQVESLREENQRLDKLVQQQKAGTSPVEKARTTLMLMLRKGMLLSKPGEQKDWRPLESTGALHPSSEALMLCHPQIQMPEVSS